MKIGLLRGFIFLLFVILFSFWGLFYLLYSDKNPVKESSHKLKAFTVIEPIAFLAKEVGGDFWKVQSILDQNQDYHTLDLKPSQIIALYQADIFFSLDNPEESPIVEKLASEQVKIANISTGAKTIPFESGFLKYDSMNSKKDHEKNDIKSIHPEDNFHNHNTHSHDISAPDPHTWLSVDNLSLFSENIFHIFSRIDPERKEYYQNNLKILKENLKTLKNRLEEVLTPYSGKSIIVMHPAYGYLLSPFHIQQISLESINGGTSSFEIPKMMKEIQEHKAEFLFIQPQYDSFKAENLAKDLGLQLVKFNPMFQDPFKEIGDVLKLMSKNRGVGN